MARNAQWSSERWELRRSLASLHPANITLQGGNEVRAFVVWLGLLLLLGMLIALAHVWLRIQVDELDYDRFDTLLIIQKLELEGQRLTADAQTLESPARLDKVARGRLEMVRLGPGQQAILP